MISDTSEVSFTPSTGTPFSFEARIALAPQSFTTNSTSSAVSITLIGLITAPSFATA